MSLQIPSSPSDGASPSTHPPSPLTPQSISQSLSDVHADSNSSTIPPAPAGKRKPSRRANTAERRATHNAVERQRRETLNGRFLDLAALLPNLSQIRRPSKSSIVNSSIAHVHASRRHRLIAARELRALKAEADALRRELNDWRDRSGIPRAEEPTRGDGFSMVLSGEVEVIVLSTQEDEQNMDDDGEDDLHTRSSEEVEDVTHAVVNTIKRSQSPIPAPSPTSHQFVHNAPPLPVHQNGVIQAHPQQVTGAPQPPHVHTQFVHAHQHQHTAPPQHIASAEPLIATHQSPVSYENPAIIYGGYPPSQFGYGVPQSYANGQLPPHILDQLTPEVDQKTASAWYNHSTGQFTPPNSSGGPSPVNSPFGGIGGGLSGGFPIAHQLRYVENGIIGRERRASIGNRGSPIGSYELAGGVHLENVPRWRSEGLVGVPGPNPTAYSLIM